MSRRLDHPLIDAIAGNQAARASLAQQGERARPVAQDERPPSTDTLLLDADPEQEQVVAEIESGSSLVVKTLPGTGGTQTIVNAIGALVAKDKRVLVVGARRASLDGIAHRLGQVGLGGAAVTTAGLRRDLIQSISRNEKAEQPRVADVDDALVRLRKVLLDYRSALTRRDPELHVSVLDALGELARLALLRQAPSTTARLDHASLVALATGRDRVARDLARAAELGEFRYGPGDSPWYGASFTSSDEATHAHELAKRLSTAELPRLLERGRALIAQTRLRPFESVAELGVFLRLLLDVRETLDRFQPSVFDRPLGELIAATSARRDSPGMSGANRRRLRRLALEYVRPGVHVGDLNGALRGIQQQRTLWQRYSEAGAIPGVPVGIDDVHVAYRTVAADLAALDAPLGVVGTPRQLAARPVRELIMNLAGLAAESEVLTNLQERTAVLSRLRELGLDPLLLDLAKRHVPERAVAAELELAWWQSVLEAMLANDTALLGANTTVLDRLEGDFRLVDEAHASAAGPLLAWHLAENWKVALDRPPRRGRPAEADAPRRPRAARDAARGHAAPLPRPRAGVARVAVRGARDRRRHRVRRRGARRRGLHDDRREPRRHPPRAAGRRLRRPRDPDADAVRDGHRRRRAGRRPRRRSGHRARRRRPARRLGARPPRRTAADAHADAQLSRRRRGPRRAREPPVLRRPHRVAAVGGQLPRPRQPGPALRRAATACPTP